MLLLATVAVIGCSRDGDEDTRPTAAAPVETPAATSEPPAEQASAAYTAQCDADLAAARAALETLEAWQGENTVATVLDPYNELTRLVDNGRWRASLFLNVHPEAAIREAATACNEKFEGLDTELSLSKPIYAAMAAVDVSGEDEKTRYFVEGRLRDFQRNGVDKDDATRERIRAIKDEITRLQNEFSKNIADDVRHISVDSAEELAGMPQDWVEAHQPGEDGKIRITTQYPDYIPFMRYADSDALRQQLYFEYQNRAYPANRDVLQKLVAKRFELAQLTGYDTWADWATADKMSGSSDAVRDFVIKAADASRDRALRDYELYIARLREIDPDAEAVMPWQSSWIGNTIRKEKYAIDAAETRPYFEYSKVRDGIFQLTEDLFGLTIKPIDLETWHASVGSYQMWQGDRLLGEFFLDMHPREGKYGHAAMFFIEGGIAGKYLPQAALVTNFPGGDGKGYMEESQVRTFLHEFGHLIHWLLMNHQRWQRSTMPQWDFVEAPSQMLQEWIYDTETLQSFATNDAGEPIPAEIVAKMRAAQNFAQGLFVYRQMSLADISLSIHDQDPATFDLEATIDAVDKRYEIFPKAEDTHFFASFGHLGQEAYSAGYYTYMWSLVIADDMFSKFAAEGLRNTTLAHAYRDKVLAQGGSRPAADSVADFLGRSYNFEAFQRKLEDES
jgi:thimet oligopeptidase